MISRTTTLAALVFTMKLKAWSIRRPEPIESIDRVDCWLLESSRVDRPSRLLVAGVESSQPKKTRRSHRLQVFIKSVTTSHLTARYEWWTLRNRLLNRYLISNDYHRISHWYNHHWTIFISSTLWHLAGDKEPLNLNLRTIWRYTN